MRINKIVIFITTLITLVVKPVYAASSNKGEKAVFTINFENDLFTGTDQGYSNGVRFAYTSGEDNAPKYLDKASSFLPLINDHGKKRVTLAGGQSIYTPSDITNPNFIPNDFLYAGWLYGTLGRVSDHGDSYDYSSLTLGIVGPSARGREAQEKVHHIVSADQPNGWDHQLRDEIGINYAYEKKWRHILETEKNGFGVDVIPHVGVNLGNIITQANVAATFRLGYDLHSDYGPSRTKQNLPGSDFFTPTKKLSGYLFAVFEARAVGRNIFIDGNTFGSGPHLNHRALVHSRQFGVSITYEDLRISFSRVFVSEEFKEQAGQGTEYGALALSYLF